jgi:hypothetical protein
LVVVGKLKGSGAKAASGLGNSVPPAAVVTTANPEAFAQSAAQLVPQSGGAHSSLIGRSTDVSSSERAHLIAGEQPAGFLDDTGALWPAALWGGALFAISRMSRWASRHFGIVSLRWVGFAGLLVLLLPWFEAISRLLPANY